MLSRPLLNRIIILVFIVLLGYTLARAIYWKSVMGIILAFVAIGATVTFLYILSKAREEIRKEETN